jgi:Rrf2 family protein
MFQLSKKADYGLLALGYMARRPETAWVKVDEIAAHHAIPGEQLCKVMQDLARAGLVEAQLGRNGGYRPTRDIHTMSAFEVVRAIDGDLALVQCLSDPMADCEQYSECTIRGAAQRLQEKVAQFMGQFTVAEMTGLAAVEAGAPGESDKGRWN